MAEKQIAPIKEYKTLDDFIRGQNNFYIHFLDHNFANELYRSRPYFQRFQKQNPELEKEVTKATVQAVNAKPAQELPYEQLWDAYKIMSKLVFLDDQYVMRDGYPDGYFLCR